MKWTRKTFRIVKRFALFPIEFDNEIRWLEMVYIKQRYNPYRDLIVTSSWESRGFARKETYLEYKRERRKNK